jgi:hypothetical protein
MEKIKVIPLTKDFMTREEAFSIINPDKIKSKVISFFEGADLDITGTTKPGKFTIKTTRGAENPLIVTSDAYDNNVSIGAIKTEKDIKNKIIKEEFSAREKVEGKYFVLKVIEENTHSDIFIIDGDTMIGALPERCDKDFLKKIATAFDL